MSAVLLAAAGLLSVGACNDAAPVSLWPARPAQPAPVDDGPAIGPLSAPAAAPEDAAALRRRLLTLVNAERARLDLPALSTSDALDQLADYHTARMIDGDFFAHVDPYDRSTVGTRAMKFDYYYAKVGETLAAGQDSADEVFAAWLASPAHRATLLDPAFSEVGVAVLDGGRLDRYWTVELGRPLGR